MKDLIIKSFARILNVDQKVLQAIVHVESRGKAFVGDLLNIRFETHIFLDRTSEPRAKASFLLGEPKWLEHWYRTDYEWKLVHDSFVNEREVFELARSIDPKSAYESISMGLGQVMGFNYKSLGYSSAEDMYIDFQKGEVQQVVGMLSFLARTEGMIRRIQEKNWYEIARLYNGSGQADYYATLLHDKYNKLVEGDA